jgi:RNAse (barnase) inhibitor barstar
MKTYVFDGKDFISERRMHEIFKEKLDFPNYYGMNVDAFWDCIFETVANEKGSFIFNNFSVFKKNIGEDNANYIIELIKEAVEKYSKGFTIEIND